jgi:hypothetical protein
MKYVKAMTEWGIGVSKVIDENLSWPRINLGTEKGIISVPRENVVEIDEAEFQTLLPQWCKIMETEHDTEPDHLLQ